MYSRLALLTFAAVSMIGCNSGKSVQPASTAWLSGTVGGSIAGEYAGDGFFYRAGGGSTLPMFGVTSRGASDDQRVLFWRNQEGMPRPGEYGFALPRSTEPDWPGFAGTYSRVVAGVAESYVATSGQVTLVSVDSNRVAGTFHLSGSLFCRRSNTNPLSGPTFGTCSPTDIPLGAPVIEFSGSFSALPLSTQGELLGSGNQ